MPVILALGLFHERNEVDQVHLLCFTFLGPPASLLDSVLEFLCISTSNLFVIITLTSQSNSIHAIFFYCPATHLVDSCMSSSPLPNTSYLLKIFAKDSGILTSYLSPLSLFSYSGSLLMCSYLSSYVNLHFLSIVLLICPSLFHFYSPTIPMSPKNFFQ